MVDLVVSKKPSNSVSLGSGALQPVAYDLGSVFKPQPQGLNLKMPAFHFHSELPSAAFLYERMLLEEPQRGRFG